MPIGDIKNAILNKFAQTGIKGEIVPSTPAVPRKDGTSIISPNDATTQALLKQASINTASISRMAPAIWSPVLQLTSMLLPRSIEEKNLWRRWYYQYDPVISTSINLHVRYPLSTFRLRCEGDDKGDISAEYEQLAERAQLFETFMKIGQGYFVTGEAFPIGNWNKDLLCWDSFWMMNPDSITVQKNPISQKTELVITNWSTFLKKVVTNGPRHPLTGTIYQDLRNNDFDVFSCIENNKPFKLSPLIASHVCRRLDEADLRGTSIIDPMFKILMYQEKLMEAQLAGAARYSTPIELWTLGSDIEPASQEALTNLENVIRQTWNSPQKAVLWGHTLKCDIVSGSGQLLNTLPEMEWITKQKCAALMINESVINAEGPTYASASVAAEYSASFYLNYRMELENWAKNHFFKQIALARGYYKPVTRQIVGHYRDKTVPREPMIPQIMWDKANLRDDYQKLQQLTALAKENKVPWEIVYDAMNLDMPTVIKQLENEAKIFGRINGLLQAANPPPGGPEGIPGGDGMPPGDITPGEGEEIGQMPPPASGVGSEGGLTMPPESVGGAPIEVGTGV